MALGMNVITHNPKVETEYNELAARLGDLRDELAAVNREINQIESSLGALVGEGKPYKKQTARLSDLRLESEALEDGIAYVGGKIELLVRLNGWLKR